MDRRQHWSGGRLTRIIDEQCVGVEVLGPDELREMLRKRALAAAEAYELEVETQIRAVPGPPQSSRADLCLDWESSHAGCAAKVLTRAGECPWQGEGD